MRVLLLSRRNRVGQDVCHVCWTGRAWCAPFWLPQQSSSEGQVTTGHRLNVCTTCLREALAIATGGRRKARR